MTCRFRLASMLPFAALAVAAMLGGCVAYPAYPAYPAYGYGYGPTPYYGGVYVGGGSGWHGGGWHDGGGGWHGDGWRR